MRPVLWYFDTKMHIRKSSYHHYLLQSYTTSLLKFKRIWSFYFNIIRNYSKEILHLQLISYKRYLECTLVQWWLSIYPWGHRQLGVPFSWNPLNYEEKNGFVWTFLLRRLSDGWHSSSCCNNLRYICEL